LTLRGEALNPPNVIERRAASHLGLDLRFVALRAMVLPPPERLLRLIDLLRTMPKPMLVHCKSGSDRTGLAVTLYLHVIKGQPLDEARRALSWKYGHWSFGSASVVHRLLDAYAAAHTATGIGFEDWVRQDYDAAALMTDPD
jgi:Protein tyrosine/serine phosphatase